MPEKPSVLYSSKNGIGTLILNRSEKHNAFDDRLIADLLKQLKIIESESNTRVVILKAEGQNFCAGADLQWMKRMATFSRDENKADALQLARLLQAFNDLSKPVIALVQGRVFGGGIGLITCCDIAIASQDARFCFSEVKLGLIPATIAPYVVRSIGFSAARRYFLSAEMIDAEEALRMGLVHRVLDENELHTIGHDLAKSIQANGPHALTAAKQLLNQLMPIDVTTNEKTAQLLADIRTSPEAKEGIQAFFDKRKSNWVKDS